VDREGKIIGHGHATRDTVEWMLPPLWPWKVLTLPARGPRPTLRGEVRMTLRVMDDLTVPQTATIAPATPGWRRFGEAQPSVYPLSEKRGSPNTIFAGNYAPSASEEATTATATSEPRLLAASAHTAAPDRRIDLTSSSAWPANVTLFALSDGTLFPVMKYYRDRDHLSYTLSDGDQGMVALDNIDWSATTRLNSSRNVRVTLRNAPPAN
jgi:hypothetical protein